MYKLSKLFLVIGLVVTTGALADQAPVVAASQASLPAATPVPMQPAPANIPLKSGPQLPQTTNGDAHPYYTRDPQPVAVQAESDNGPRLAPVVQAQPMDTLSAPQNTDDNTADKTQSLHNGWTMHRVDQNDAVATNVASQSAPVVSGTQNLSMLQRVTRLEQQMQNTTRMNLPQQVSDLQQEMQQINGQLQVQQHDIKLLNDQLRSFYQDLSQQIQQLKNLNGSSAVNSNSAPVKATPNVGVSMQMRETNAFNGAFKLLRQRQYDKARAEFQSYLSNYPNGHYIVNAHYWLGEINLQQKDSKAAASEFNIVIKQFPKSTKAADARLKLALIHIQNGNLAAAKQELLTIKQQQPGSTAAQLATIKLQQLEAMPASQ
ncbi:MAG: tol-pal system protein YbgF [Gammaproteobacteria bacterium]|nr:tol-pal system protein YbgF [Gammaproteobacteria bacterium]